MEPDLTRVGEIREALGQAIIPVRIIYGPDVRPPTREEKWLEIRRDFLWEHREAREPQLFDAERRVRKEIETLHMVHRDDRALGDVVLELESDFYEAEDRAWEWGWAQGFLDAQAIVGEEAWREALDRLLKQALGPGNPEAEAILAEKEAQQEYRSRLDAIQPKIAAFERRYRGTFHQRFGRVRWSEIQEREDAADIETWRHLEDEKRRLLESLPWGSDGQP